MTTHERRGAYREALKVALGSPYRWGGKDETRGFDCSGLIVWALRKAGINVPDTDANGLYAFFHPYKRIHTQAPEGSLFFYCDETRGRINHVMTVYMVWPNGTRVLCGARGGTSKTLTLEDAARDNAFVDLVISENYMPQRLIMCVDPFAAGGVNR